MENKTMTIGDETRIWKQTGGRPSPDGQKLMERLVNEIRANNYDQPMSSPNSESTHHPLYINPTINEAVETYREGREGTVDPILLNALEETSRYNTWAKQQSPHLDTLDDIQITDYTTVLHLANQLIQNEPYRERKTKTTKTLKKSSKVPFFFMSRTVKKYDTKTEQIFTDPIIIIVTNPEVDQLPSVLRENLVTLERKNVGLKIINFGESDSKDITQFLEMPGFSYANVSLRNPSDKTLPHFGVYTTEGSISGRFTHYPDSPQPLLGLQNIIEATLELQGAKQIVERKMWKCRFDALK